MTLLRRGCTPEQSGFLGRVAARSRCFLDFYALGDHRDALGDQRDSHVYALGDQMDALGDHDEMWYP